MITLNLRLPSSEVLSELFNAESNSRCAYDCVKNLRNIDPILIDATSGIVVDPDRSFQDQHILDGSVLDVEENTPEQCWLPTSYRNKLSGTYIRTKAKEQYDGIPSVAKTDEATNGLHFSYVYERQKLCADNDEYWQQYCTSQEMQTFID